MKTIHFACRSGRPSGRSAGILAPLLLALLIPQLSAAEPLLPEPEKVAAHSWAWVGPYGPPTAENRGFRMNLGFVVGDEAVAVIDSGYSDAMAGAMREHIAAVTDRPIRYVINTNSQPHRVLGNAAFREAGAEIIAGAEAAPRITDQGADLALSAESVLGVPAGSIRAPGAPERLVESIETLDLGGVTLRVIPVGTAHTAGSLVVEVVEDKIVFAGDVLYGGRLLAVLPVSRSDGWLEAFGELRAFDGALFVPGHGAVGPLADFEHPTHDYLLALKTHMDAAVDEGTGLQEAIGAFDQSPWQDLADFDLLSGRNAHQTYLEREAAAFE
ncbi:MAG: MBL fold metallo-hydrolase [Thiohalocapsa sp.]|nr:MBL fold metallo-hydrolase [Thiohalocapsa sp.]